MTGNLSQPQTYGRPAARGFGRMLVLSLIVHSAVVVIFFADLFPHARRELRPLYFVDLINLPVPDPQAGRPDARPAEKSPAPIPPAPAPPPGKMEAPVTAKPLPVKPPVAVKPEPAKTAPKEVPKTPAKPEASAVDEYQSTANAIEKMREKKELEERLAAIKASRQSTAAPVDAPVGMPTGKGKSAGVDEQLWIQAYLKECWNLSKYQVTRRDLKAKARLVFDAGGQLIDYRIITPSGDSNFDESVRRAILKAKQLPFRPERRLELDGEQAVEFNLKDLLD
jgi:colicin import membrane protein